jgi:hypothetical protein
MDLIKQTVTKNVNHITKNITKEKELGGYGIIKKTYGILWNK